MVVQELAIDSSLSPLCGKSSLDRLNSGKILDTAGYLLVHVCTGAFVQFDLGNGLISKVRSSEENV